MIKSLNNFYRSSLRNTKKRAILIRITIEKYYYYSFPQRNLKIIEKSKDSNKKNLSNRVIKII